jgi:putative addiction module killer protein
MAFQIKQTRVFEKWHKSLKDARVRGLIASRLDRLGQGHWGDVTALGDGVSELRIHFGPGYRIYFQRRNEQIIVLLCGGNKSSQAGDILAAKKISSCLE